MSDLERFEFWSEFPDVRLVTVHPDGTLSGYERISARALGGHIPNVGDVIGDVWGLAEYDFQIVQRRYFIREYQGETFWLILLRDAEANGQFDAVSENVLLVTDLYKAIAAVKPPKRSQKKEDEILARIAQLGSPATATKRFKPKRRHQ